MRIWFQPTTRRSSTLVGRDKDDNEWRTHRKGRALRWKGVTLASDRPAPARPRKAAASGGRGACEVAKPTATFGEAHQPPRWMLPYAGDGDMVPEISCLPPVPCSPCSIRPPWRTLVRDRSSSSARTNLAIRHPVSFWPPSAEIAAKGKCCTRRVPTRSSNDWPSPACAILHLHLAQCVPWTSTMRLRSGGGGWTLHPLWMEPTA